MTFTMLESLSGYLYFAVCKQLVVPIHFTGLPNELRQIIVSLKMCAKWSKLPCINFLNTGKLFYHSCLVSLYFIGSILTLASGVRLPPGNYWAYCNSCSQTLQLIQQYYKKLYLNCIIGLTKSFTKKHWPCDLKTEFFSQTQNVQHHWSRSWFSDLSLTLL